MTKEAVMPGSAKTMSDAKPLQGAVTIRVQLDLPQTQVKELDFLMEQTGVSTRKDFINNALSLLVWAIKQKKQGRIIAAVDEEGKTYQEVIMPMLDYIK
jgi:metal-responsive CopG/Arc/MetJ family transcriptional regulator